MKRIAGRGGHALDVQGAVGLLNEVSEDRKITAAVFKRLRELGYPTLDVTTGYMGTSGKDLTIPMNQAKAWGADYFFSLHLNAGGGKGCEVLAQTSEELRIASYIDKKIAGLGFTNRGVKVSDRSLYEFNATPGLTNNIIEVCFVDSSVDYALYKQLGPEVIGIAIAEGINEAFGGTTTVTNGWLQVGTDWYYYKNGIKQTKVWMQDSKGWLYLDESGKMAKKKWAQDSKDKWFYLDDKGRILKNGWAMDTKDWCYCGPTGEMAVNEWHKDSKGECYCGSDGRIVHDTVVDGRTINKDGYAIN